MEDKKYTLKEHIIYFVSNEESVHTKRKCKSVDSLSSIGCYLYHAAFNMVMIIGLYALFIFGTFSLFTITESIFIIIILGAILTVFCIIPFCWILLGSIVKYVPILALPVYLIFLFASLFEHNILSDYRGFTSYYVLHIGDRFVKCWNCAVGQTAANVLLGDRYFLCGGIYEY